MWEYNNTYIRDFPYSCGVLGYIYWQTVCVVGSQFLFVSVTGQWLWSPSSNSSTLSKNWGWWDPAARLPQSPLQRYRNSSTFLRYQYIVASILPPYKIVWNTSSYIHIILYGALVGQICLFIMYKSLQFRWVSLLRLL